MTANPSWDDFVAVHAEAFHDPMQPGDITYPAHGGPSFLAWHRAFLLRMEEELREIKPNVTIPYWDWTNCAGDPDCFPDFLGGTGVAPAPFISVTWPVRYRDSEVPLAIPEALSRALQPVANLPKTSDVNAVLNVLNFDSPGWNISSTNSFRNRLEGWSPYGLHNKVHNWVGGSMISSTSPNDPIFFLHHANIDRIWCQWQETNPLAYHHLPDGAFNPANDPSFVPAIFGMAPEGHNVFDPMEPFGGMQPGNRPFDMLNVAALGYEYDDTVGPCHFADGLTASQYQILHDV